MLGTQTRGGRMVGADKSTELWRHPKVFSLYLAILRLQLDFQLYTCVILGPQKVPLIGRNIGVAKLFYFRFKSLHSHRLTG